MAKYICSVCGYVYDEAAGAPDNGIEPGTVFADVPEDWKCPWCAAPKSMFKAEEPEGEDEKASEVAYDLEDLKDVKELSVTEISALCSNLSKGCEKQYLEEESKLFAEIADYYKQKAVETNLGTLEDLHQEIKNEMSGFFPLAHAVSDEKQDRGAKRAVVWSEKVTNMIDSILTRYESEGPGFLENTKVYVCEICGFIYVGDELPEVCPVCKVPNFKMIEVVS